MSATILDLLRRRSARSPVKVALEFEGRRFTFADVEGGSNAAARVLRSHGVGPGDRVLICAATSLELVLAYLGTLKLRAIAVFANPAYREGELAWIAQDSEPAAIVSDRAAAALAAKVAPPSVRALLQIERGEGEPPSGGPPVYPFYQALKKAPVHPIDELVDAADPALLLYTSGTTGRAKGALLTHGNLAACAQGLIDAWAWTDSDRLVHALPLFHVHGLCVALNGSLAAGAETHLLPRFDAPQVLDAIAREKATLFMGVPTMFRRLIDELARKTRPLASLRLCISGSAPLGEALAAELEAATGKRVLERYGMTETLITLAQRADRKTARGAVGVPIAGVEARVVDSDLRDAAAGVTGELLVRGATVGPGYWKNPAATDASRIDGWFATGDLARVDADGEFRIVGRARDLIITGGYNVYPREVEDALLAHPAVAEAHVYGAPDGDLGEAVSATVVLRAGKQAGAAELIAFVRERIAAYKQPRAIAFVDALPRNAMGKVSAPRAPGSGSASAPP